MKKVISVVLSLILALSMSACGAKEPSQDDTDEMGAEAFDDPQFVQQNDYSGTWNMIGDSNAGVSYQLTDTHAAKVGSTDNIDTTYQQGLMRLPGDGLEDQPYLELEGTNVDLFPSKDGNILVEKNFTEYEVYAREGQEDTAQCGMTKTLLDFSLAAEADEDIQGFQRLEFQPNFSFGIILMEQEEGGFYSQSGTGEVGIWSLDEDLNLSLSFEDGTQLSFNLNTWDGTLDLGDRGLFWVE